jgi:hypothetical protein
VFAQRAVIFIGRIAEADVLSFAVHICQCVFLRECSLCPPGHIGKASGGASDALLNSITDAW